MIYAFKGFSISGSDKIDKKHFKVFENVNLSHKTNERF